MLDEPTTGLHPSDVDLLLLQHDRLVDAGNTVVVVEHDIRAAAAAGTPDQVSRSLRSRTAPFLRAALTGALSANPKTG